MDDWDNVKSVFNAGVAFATRIDSLQKAINAARFNLRAFNFETGTFNYEVMKNALHCLLSECWGKLNNDEKIVGESIKNTIETFLKFRPVVKQIKTRNGESPQIDEKNFQEIEKLLNIYDKRIKEFMELHAINSPNKDWGDEGW